MSINDPKIRHHGFVIPNQASHQQNIVNGSPSTPSQNLDPSFLLSESLWDQSEGSERSDNHIAGDKINVIPSITIPVEYPQHREDTIMVDDLADPAGFGSRGTDMNIDPWTHLLPGLADLKYQHPQLPQSLDSAPPTIRSAAEYATSRQDRASIPPRPGSLQAGNSLMSMNSTDSRSPSTAGGQSVASGDTELTPPSLSDGQQQSQLKSPLGPSESQKRSRSATATTAASRVDRHGSEQMPSASHHHHSRSLSQSASVERAKIRRSQSTSGKCAIVDNPMGLDDPDKDKSRSPVQSSTGKAPRSRSRPARRASIGPAAHANEVKAAAANMGPLKIDTSSAAKDFSAANTGPHTVSGVPLSWSASPWSHHPGGFPWPAPFGSSSLPATSPGWPPLPPPPHPHWTSMYGHHPPAAPELWYSQHMMAVAAAAAGYPLPHPSGTWAFTPAGSLPPMSQPVACAASPELPAHAHMWPLNMQPQPSGDHAQSDVNQVNPHAHAGSDSSPAMEGILSDEGPVSATTVPSNFSLEDFLREHKSMPNAVFPPSGSTGLDQTDESVDMKDVTVTKLSKSAPTEKQHRASSTSTARGRRMSMKSTEPLGRVLEDVPESSALDSQSPFPSGKSETESNSKNGRSTSSAQSTKKAPPKDVKNENGNAASGGGDAAEGVSTSARSPTDKKASNTSAKKGRTSKSRAVRPEAERRKRRRESHNMVERRRRDAINERIAELASLLPETMLLDAIAHSQGGGNNSKVVKVPMPESALHKLAHGGYTSPHEAALDALASAPADSETLAAAQARPNKGIILKKSVDYIRALQDFIEQQATHNRMLQEQMARLSGATGPTHETGAALPSSSWSVDRLAHTFDLSHFDASRSAMDGRQPNETHAVFPYVSSAGGAEAAGGESPPQTLADWLASNSEENQRKGSDDHEEYDDLFSESGNADREGEDDDGEDSDDEVDDDDEDEDEDDEDEDTLRTE